ncbi:MAG: hydroxyacid dehydrogenase [Mesotoga sp.]|jgi:D-3-phosphoglycerate dehydrogenase|nr:hydroxyacid dehydrogenase [Mesotoga sp.]NLI07510.1 hydroxyacid dehydrogenase [Thermotogaceae bacterium]HNS66262.1 hydroxyacid dehydrogenase [Mesotoga infera]HON28323.1 hydroxyacid dehydrogenase [Mesotoga infera]
MLRLHANDPLDKTAMKILADSGLFDITAEALDKNALLKIMPEVEILVVRSATKVTAEIIEAGKKLKLIARAGVGLDNVDAEAAEARGIMVKNTPGANAISVAELTFGLLLGLVRQIPRGVYGIKDGKWEKKDLKGNEIFGKTMGIIGFGAIGRTVAKIALAFGMKVVAYDPYVNSTDLEVTLVDSIEKLLPKADVVSLHIPLTPETKHIIGEKEISLMKDGVIIINASRGGTIDEQALYNGLISEKISGAALDVFEVEPPSDELRRKLIGLGNVICTPHIGASTSEGQKRVGLEMAKIIVDVCRNML